jgi:endonuclease YncB( thermonuclease family)
MRRQGDGGWRGEACWAAGTYALAFAALAAIAQPLAATGQDAAACRFEVVGSGRVGRILDGATFLLEDGREVRLAALEVPPLPGPDDAGPPARAGVAARTALTSIIAGQTVELRQPAPATDRYGRIAAHVHVLGGTGPGQPVAMAMLAGGFARVSSRVGDAACATLLLSHERVARAQKIGLWGDPTYAILRAERGSDLLAGRGQFAVAEGRVLSVRESGGTIFVNFGRRWSEALTVTISKRNERMFAAAGLPPKTLESRQVRVRGWVEERNGPRIEITRPEQIELAELTQDTNNRR